MYVSYICSSCLTGGPAPQYQRVRFHVQLRTTFIFGCRGQRSHAMYADDQVQGEVAPGWRHEANIAHPAAPWANYNRFSVGGAMGRMTNRKEIPYVTLLKRARCLPIFVDELKDRIIKYLPRVHTQTFTNCGDRAKCLRGFGALLNPADAGKSLAMSMRKVSMKSGLRDSQSSPDLYLVFAQSLSAIVHYVSRPSKFPASLC